MPTIGHNSIAGDQLKSFLERIEKLDAEKSAIAADIRDVFAEAKGGGFNVKIMRKVLKLRKMSDSDREEEEHLVDLYAHAVGLKAILE